MGLLRSTHKNNKNALFCNKYKIDKSEKYE